MKLFVEAEKYVKHSPGINVKITSSVMVLSVYTTTIILFILNVLILFVLLFILVLFSPNDGSRNGLWVGWHGLRCYWFSYCLIRKCSLSGLLQDFSCCNLCLKWVCKSDCSIVLQMRRVLECVLTVYWRVLEYVLTVLVRLCPVWMTGR